MAYFYFDFRDDSKQSLYDLLPSLLTQLSARSSARCDILSKLYLDHDNGKNQPSDSVLIKCLKDTLALPDHRPIYLIMDALDESPVTSGIPSAREKVLHLLKELVDLDLPNLHICATSRPEIDIRNAIEPLTSLRVSLHDETGQKEDIAEYVRSIVYSNSDTNMKRWKAEDKDLVVKTLAERADGMCVDCSICLLCPFQISNRFRWVFCQLEILRDCFPSSVQRFLGELPESLDETYERVLREMKKPIRDHARRLLQCLVVAIRPLEVEELAEILAIDFDDAEEIPTLNPSWRWEDREGALLTSCSSLIAIIDTGDSRVVQFSHFSVKEYLTSARLATSSQDVSNYHIAFKPAHTILAQACVSVLLQFGDNDEPGGVEKNGPLAMYAAQYWVRHAQFEDVVSCIKGMEYLFDLDKPYFRAWRRLYDIDIDPPNPSVFYRFTPRKKSEASTLYYAALCGFPDLVEQLMVKHPEHVNAIGGCYMTPAVAALAGRHFKLAEVLHRNGSSVEPRGVSNVTPLHSAALYGDLEMVQVLLEFGVDVDCPDIDGDTPLTYASLYGHRNDARVARLLIERGADPNARGYRGYTPLHQASGYGRIDIARLLIVHGANVEVRCDYNVDNEYYRRTPLDVARGDEMRNLLLELSAK